MGNEIKTQNIQNYSMYNPAMFNSQTQTIPAGMNMGLFNGQFGMNNYNNDVMAPDFIKNQYFNNPVSYNQTLNNINQDQSIFDKPNSQTLETPSQTFTGNEEVKETGEIESVIQEDEKDKPEKTNICKTFGITAGILTSLATSLSKTNKLKFKELGIKSIAFAIAGWCAGAIIDGFINRNKETK